MSPIELCLDYAGLVKPRPEDVVVSEISQYVAAYVALTHALHSSESTRIVVRHRACGEWLRQVRAKYGADRITITQISCRSMVEELWGVRVPDWVQESDLVASRLLDMAPLQATPGQSFEDLVLEVFWGATFAHPRLPLGRLAEMANRFSADQWQASDAVPVAHAILARRLTQWEDQAQRPGERMLIAVIKDTPERLNGLLSQLRALRGYPQEVGLRCLGETYGQLASLGLDLGTLTLDGSALTQAIAQVKVYLQGIVRSSVDESVLDRVLEQVSGDLVEEYDWVEGLLKAGQVATSRDLLDRIASVFQPIRHRIAYRLADLDLLIEPSRPPKPSEDWEVSRWIEWAVREYLPYRFWLEAKDVLDEEIATFADEYGDWLFGTFPGLIGQYKPLAYRAILNLRETVGEGQVLLFVLLDNLGFRYANELRSMMLARGYRSTEPIAYLSMLPSATEVSKKAMAAGDPSGFPGTAYRDVVETTWREQFGRETKYLGRVGDLQSLSTREHEVYVLNYTPIDDALHSDPRSTGVSHTQAVRQALSNLVDAIHAFALRFGIEDTLRVAVCADHGSTLIPSETPNVIDADFIAKRVDDVHHRYVALTDHELDKLPQSVRDQCYCFRSGVFDLPSSYLAARGYGRFRKSETASFVHGGLTPEETLVPFMVFQRTHVMVQRPTLRLLENVFRYGVRSRVQLEIVNTNALPLERVRIEITWPEGSTEPYAMDDAIAAGAVVQLLLDNVRIRDTQGDVKEFALLLTYECSGEERRDEYALPVTMRRIMTSSLDLNL